MSVLLLYLRSALYLLFLVMTVIPYALVMMPLIVTPLPVRYRYAAGWPKMAIWAARFFCGVRYEVYGLEHLRAAEQAGSVIVLSKHQSAWETLFIPAYLRPEVCFVYKRELHWVPFFGWGLAMLRMVSIDRSQGGNAFEQVVEQGGQRLAEGRFIVIFPEGTRTRLGSVTKYKTGGARLAVRTGAKVLPLALNSAECWPRNAFVKRPGLIQVSFGPLIDSQGKTAEQLNLEVQYWIEAEVRRLSPEAYAHEQRT